MIRSTLRAVAAALLVVFALAGCSPDSRPVARVGRHTITVGDFLRAARRSNTGMQLPPEQARPMLLQELVGNELLLVAAEAHGVDTTTFTRQHRRAATEQALLAALSAQIAPQDPGVTEAEVRTLYEWRKTRSDVQLVYASDSTSMALAVRRIEAGDPLALVANEFGGAGVLPPGGEIGFRVPGSFPQPIDDAMRTQAIGHIGGPYHAAVGWFLVRVSRRAPVPEGPFEQERAPLESLIRRRKWQATLLAGVANLGPAHHLYIATDAGQTLFRALASGRVGGLANAMPVGAQREQVLARFDGGTYTLGDAWDDLSGPDTNKPSSSMVPSLAAWVRERALLRIALVEAHDRHLDQDPTVAGPLADEMSDYILRGEAANVPARVAPPDEATLRATWEPVKDRFPMLVEARVTWLVTADTAKAVAIARGSGRASLREVAHAVDPAITVHDETLRFPNPDPQWAGAQRTLQGLQAGQWSSPEVTDTGFRMLQLVDKVQGPVAWDQLPLEVQRSLSNTLLQRARQTRLSAYTDSLRRAINPVLMPEALRNVPWPATAGGTP